MKKLFAVFAIICLVLLIISVFAVILLDHNLLFGTNKPEVYVGTTYSGDSVTEGKLLIDKVSHYTNLFVLQSSSLQRDFKSVNELGDYAISSGLYFLPYFGAYIEPTFSAWLETAKQRWGDHFLGVYYGDEPGGKMLDDYVQFQDATTGNTIMKTTYGDIVIQMKNGVVIHYEINGDIIHLSELVAGNDGSSTLYSTFYPNGTITGQRSNESNFKTYQDLMSLKPLKNNDEVAQRFKSNIQEKLEPLKNSSTEVFTSDYALFWWDYESGYDVLLAQIGWNLTLNQQIGLARGAANLQNKEWGIVLTWKYNQPPYLDSGANLLGQMRTAYESGAKYYVVYNYYENNGSSYGTLKEEHFQALEDFWNNIVKNPKVDYDSIRADSVLILPKNYGWGMRWKEDKIWGIFNPDDQTKQIWALMQTTLANHGIKTDIVYEDTNYPAKEQYQNIYIWSQE
jgi:hypothetical protein